MNQEETAEVEKPLILDAEEKQEGKEEEGGEPIIKQMETENAAGLVILLLCYVILVYCEETWKGHIEAFSFPLRKNLFCLIFECSFDTLDLDLHRKLSAKSAHLGSKVTFKYSSWFWIFYLSS